MRLISHLPQLVGSKTCFLFDLDGTLVDSNACHERAYLAALQAHVPEAALRFDYEICKGRPTREALRLFGIADEALIAQVTEAKQRNYREFVEAGAVVLLPHARELLGSLIAKRRRVFLVTGASARSTRTLLTQLGILTWFEQIVTADDVAHGKPAPDCWLTCAARAGLAHNEALAIEDALNGVEAARAAGMDCVAVNNPALAHLPEYAGTLGDLLAALA